MKLKLLLVVLVGFLGNLSFSQTTVSTNHTNNNGNGSVIFNVQNTNAFDIIITDVNCHLGTSATNNIQLLYNTSPYNDIAAPWDFGTVGAGQNGWISAGTAVVNSNTANGVVNALTGLSLTVPAGATYQLGLSATTMQYMSLTNGGGANINTFTGGGVNLITGDGVSWGGTAYPATPANYPRGFIGGITFIAAVPCTAPPTAGNAVAANALICPSTNNTISLTGGTGGTGQTYQWQSSADGITYANIAGATNSTYVANQSTATYYQCVVTCSGLSSTSGPVMVGMTPFTNCYCSSAALYTSDEEIYNVTINGGSTDPLYASAAGCSTPAPGPGSSLGLYSNFKSLAPITTIAGGQTVNFSIVQDECDGPTYYGNGVAMWVDFNQNGVFTDAGEQVFVEATTATGPRTINGSFVVPGNAVPGNTVVRIICAEGFSGSSLTPCLSYGYGETEDHLITISCPTFAGVTTIDAGVCAGNTVTLTGSVASALPTTISWWDAAVGGTQVGTGASFTTPTLVANATYWSQEDYAGCPSSARDQVNITVTGVDVVLVPVNVSCNGNNNGSFTQTTVACGTGPFEYSLDNGVTFGPIPTDLVAGTYSVIVKDNAGFTSVAYQVIVTQPAAPAALTLVDANYYSADVSWTTTGNETSWNIEYGPAGFTPGTGTVITAFTNFATFTNLTVDTDYEFYVTPVCGANPETSGPAAFSTNPGFFTFDNQCGPGYNDISATGVGTDLFDDNEIGFTLPWTLDFQGTSVTQLTIGNNGGIIFNTLTGNLNWTNTSMTTAATGLYPYWDDLLSNGGAVYTEIVGTAPNRSAIIQWNVSSYGPSTEYAFQVVIEEATDEIYYIYDNTVVGDAFYDNGVSATIGVAGPLTDIDVSLNNTSYLLNNSCAHFYNALCPNPTNMVTTVFQEEIDLDWTAGAYGETDWTVIYGPVGFDPATSGTILTTTTSDIQITGLTQVTEYDIYVYSECALDNITSDGFLINAITLPWCPDPITLNATSEVDSIMMTWDWIPAIGATNGGISSFNIEYGQTGYNLYSGTEIVANGVDFADSVVSASFLPGQVIDVYVQSVCGVDSSNYVGPFTIVMPLSNDTVCGAEELMVDGTVYIFNNTGATVTSGETGIVPSQTGYNATELPQAGWGQPTLQRTTWFTFTAPASGSIRFSGEDVDAFWSQIAIYDAPICNDFNTFELFAASDQATVTTTTVGNTTTIDTFKVAPNFTICGLTPGNTYYIMHDSWAGASGASTLQGEYSIAMTPITLEAGTFVDVLDACTGTSVVLFDGIAGYEAEGTWTAELAPAGTGLTDSLFNTSGLGYQVFDFEYRVTDGCAYDSIVAQVQIFPLSSAGTDGTITVCRNEPVDLLSGLGGNVDLGGSWYNPSNQLMPSSSIYASNIPGQFNYDYITGNGVCPDDTANVLLTVGTCNWANLEEMYFSSMTLLPNPTNGLVYITNEGNSEVFNYDVIDIDGRVIASKANAINGASTTTIDLTGKVTGMYMIRVYNGNAEKVFRVVLQ